jgi:hypothetical protein
MRPRGPGSPRSTPRVSALGFADGTVTFLLTDIEGSTKPLTHANECCTTRQLGRRDADATVPLVVSLLFLRSECDHDFGRKRELESDRRLTVYHRASVQLAPTREKTPGTLGLRASRARFCCDARSAYSEHPYEEVAACDVAFHSPRSRRKKRVGHKEVDAPRESWLTKGNVPVSSLFRGCGAGIRTPSSWSQRKSGHSS